MVVLIRPGAPVYKTHHIGKEGPRQPGGPSHQVTQAGIEELYTSISLVEMNEEQKSRSPMEEFQCLACHKLSPQKGTRQGCGR